MKNNSAKEQFINTLPNKILMLAAAWEDFSQKSPSDTGFMEELASVLIVTDTLKELCAAKKMDSITNELAEIEGLLTSITETSIQARKLVYSSITKKLNTLVGTSDKEDGLSATSGVGVISSGVPAAVGAALESNEVILGGIVASKSVLSGDGKKSVAVLEQNPIIVSEPVFSSGGGSSRNVYIVSNDTEFVSECSVQIGHYGYCAHSFSSFVAYKNGLLIEEPVAVIADIDLVYSDPDSRGDLNLFCTTRDNTPVPLIIVGSNSDFNSRLQAVRAGSASFFAKPVNVSLLLDKLDAIISNAYVVEPFRVLVVDDSETMIRFISRTLKQAGMSVHVEQYPDKVLQAIGEFNPDLILMDMYMPHCDGQELSRIIRQYESYTSIPIVFLSSEMDIKKQLAAMQIGADDFLTKPIDPEHLVSSVNTRVQRHRILASYMVQDSLTGLLNHTKLKQRLEQTLQKTARSRIPMSFAMVDIDHFKKVNDTYGHPMGDRVIKSLSRLLQKRLRKTDSIGRYGGEEFAVIFWDADVNAASAILDDIREDFAHIEHHHEGKSFSCTFSAGVAGFPEYPDAQSISNAADRALYVAKRQGRNQVIIASD